MKKGNKIQKMLVIVLAAVCILALAACGGDKPADKPADQGTATPPASSEKLIMATNAEFPPFEFVTQKGVVGEFDGIDVVMASEIAKIMGVELQITNMKFEGIIPALLSGTANFGMAGMTIDPERAQEVDFSDPYWVAVQSIIVPVGNTAITDAKSLVGKKVGVVTGFTGDLAMTKEAGVNLTRFKNGVDAVQELINGNVEAVVIDSPTAAALVAKNAAKLTTIEDKNYFSEEQYAIAVKKGNTELLGKINAAIAQLKEAGRIEEIAAEVDTRLAAE